MYDSSNILQNKTKGWVRHECVVRVWREDGNCANLLKEYTKAEL